MCNRAIWNIYFNLPLHAVKVVINCQSYTLTTWDFAIQRWVVFLKVNLHCQDRIDVQRSIFFVIIYGRSNTNITHLMWVQIKSQLIHVYLRIIQQHFNSTWCDRLFSTLIYKRIAIHLMGSPFSSAPDIGLSWICLTSTPALSLC